MSATTTVRCAYCESTVPADETFFNGSVSRCKDSAACEYRQLALYDPTIVRAEDRPVPPPMGAPPGAACANCGATEGLYGGAAWMCRDRAGCEQRSVEFYFLAAHREDFPEVAVTKMTTGMHAARAAGAQIPPEPTELDPAEMASLAAQEALGRKRPVR